MAIREKVEGGLDRVAAAVDFLICDGLCVAQFAIGCCKKQVSFGVDSFVTGSGEGDVDCSGVGSGLDDPVAFEGLLISVDLEIDVWVDVAVIRR